MSEFQSVRSVADVMDVLDLINQLRRDPEAAHSNEDGLYEAVLRAVCDRSIDLPEALNMARVALTSKDIEFERWSA